MSELAIRSRHRESDVSMMLSDEAGSLARAISPKKATEINRNGAVNVFALTCSQFASCRPESESRMQMELFGQRDGNKSSPLFVMSERRQLMNAVLAAGRR